MPYVFRLATPDGEEEVLGVFGEAYAARLHGAVLQAFNQCAQENLSPSEVVVQPVTPTTTMPVGNALIIVGWWTEARHRAQEAIERSISAQLSPGGKPATAIRINLIPGAFEAFMARTAPV